MRHKTTGIWSCIDPAKTYVLVTHDFIAEGKDGYNALGTVFKTGRAVNTYLLCAQRFVDYVMLKGSMARPAREDYLHQAVITQKGVNLP